jgi:hypothetical protein
MSEKNSATTRRGLVAGRILSGFVAVFLLFASATPKLMLHPSATESFERFGFDVGVTLPLGILEASIAILYLLPRTSVLGAILMTGLLGGATATQLRIEDPWFVFPLVIGGMAWLGLYLREPQLRALVPLRKDASGPGLATSPVATRAGG